MKVTENTTVKEIHDICLKHQKQNRDCESCPIYRFCMQMTISYPSGWKLEVEHAEK